ncbi:carboxyltransferase domain-containing protein [Ottowia sp.]|uniref:5-oxoprolinase subunit B/C family protein n=1 Tax=Ottowia sp. TaxID=1898956 RepID=UPI003A87B7BC
MLMRVLPAADNAVLVELADLSQTLSLLASLQAKPIAGVTEVVPGARTLLVTFDAWALDRSALVAELGRRPLNPHSAQSGDEVETPVHDIPVFYDGEDLPEVAALLGITPQDVVRRHTGCEWQVAFTGFAPGFAYLSGGDELLRQVPRKPTPRTRLPAGAVAVAGGFSGIYPKASPGGWQVLGQTLLSMWDLQRDPPALLQPGARVRFVDAGPRPAQAAKVTAVATAPASYVASAASVAVPRVCAPAIEIVRTGWQALWQDLGRPGLAHLGLGPAGALDRGALRAANRLVGNPMGAVCIEAAYGGLELLSHGPTTVAVTGADGPLSLIAPDGRRCLAPRHAPIVLKEGERLHVGQPRAGVRSYVAVHGGWDVAAVLGSCAYDSLAQIGPAPLAVGQQWAVRTPAVDAVVGHASAPCGAWPAPGDEVTLNVRLGPRADWFTPEALALLATQTWTVTPESNRIGLRVQGAQALTRAVRDELPSEGTALGAIQVPASGQPVLFLADHPLTGGYPVIGCVVAGQLDLLGQIPAGVRLRFRVVAGFETVQIPPVKL